ncbi:hypothetical protein KM043_006786 [Ampulex compressa]|nr:hypothetical protein KM043_006786 [Ampulex compressa]
MRANVAPGEIVHLTRPIIQFLGLDFCAESSEATRVDRAKEIERPLAFGSSIASARMFLEFGGGGLWRIEGKAGCERGLLAFANFFSLRENIPKFGGRILML